jgi:hypothetical protein
MYTPFHTTISTDSKTYFAFIRPLLDIIKNVPELKSKGDKPLQLTFEHQLNALIYFHLQNHDSARHLIQELNEDEFAKEFIAPDSGVSRSSFSEAINSRGLEQLLHVFSSLSNKAHGSISKEYSDLGDLVAIDGTLIDSVLSMHWADYRNNSKKGKGHFGFDINRDIPTKVFLTNGNGAERTFVNQILSPGQTGVMDRGYQEHKAFDQLQRDGKHFVCRIKRNTTKNVVKTHKLILDSHVFYDAMVILGKHEKVKTKLPVRVVGYKIEGIEYFIATDRFDLSAEQIAAIYKLRWKIETFFKWWKQYLSVYHLIARSEYGLMVQILAGMITYLLMAIHCKEKYNQPVSVKKIRQLRIVINNELRNNTSNENTKFSEDQKRYKQICEKGSEDREKT